MNPRRRAAVCLSVLLVLGAGACGRDAEPTDVTPSAVIATETSPVSPEDALARIADGASVIDVRTAQEFDAGHLDGAVNLDVQQADFADQVAELPREASYVVYCASGRRAVGAVETMVGLGFVDVVNGGGYDDLADG